ncbi:MAG: hypothetical protein HYX37_15730 [Rhizobiales bacterium]|nr:hypothetical protein [Hyphomicrobiales bacterium]
MKPFASRRPRCFAPIAAACGLALLTAPLFVGWAQAFTIEDQGGAAKSDGARNAVADPDGRASRFGSGNGQSTIKQGNTTLQFGARPSFNQQYNNDRMFEPLGRPGGPDPR